MSTCEGQPNPPNQVFYNVQVQCREKILEMGFSNREGAPTVECKGIKIR
jgi:hypothetical protein